MDFDLRSQFWLPLAILDALLLVVRVRELEDLEDKVQLLPLPHEVAVEEEGEVGEVFEVRRVVARSLSESERRMADP